MAKETLKSISVSKDQVVDLEIESMVYDNSAIAHFNNFVIFVERGAPGDKVEAKITTLRPDYARARIANIKGLDSKYRIDAPCRLYKVCGGCQWQHLSYEKQLEQKDLLMEQFTSKLQLKEGVLKKIISAGLRSEDLGLRSKSHTQSSILRAQSSGIWHYRNKVQYPVRTVESTGRLKAGYFEWHSNDLVNIKYCPVGNNLFDGIIDTVRELAPKYGIEAYNSKSKTGWLRHICVRTAVSTGETLLTLVAVNDKLPKSQEFVNEILNKHPELIGICINENRASTNVIYGPKTFVLKGKGYITEEIRGIKYKISATSFFQINTMQTEKMLDVIENVLGEDMPWHVSTMVDAYCGVGLISLFLANKAKKIIGIEEIKQAIDDAMSSTQINNIKNAVFINGKVENKIDDVLEKENPEVVILDPPRAGCNKKVLNSVLKSKAKKVIYVSCNPSTLVRDLGILTEGEFNIETIQPLDMFPHTYHIESVVSLVRNKK